MICPSSPLFFLLLLFSHVRATLMAMPCASYLFSPTERRESEGGHGISLVYSILRGCWLGASSFRSFFCCCSLVSLLSPTSLMSYLLSRSQCVCVCVYIMRLRSESGATASLRLLRRRPLFFPSTGEGERGSGDARMHTQAAVNCVELAICRR